MFFAHSENSEGVRHDLKRKELDRVFKEFRNTLIEKYGKPNQDTLGKGLAFQTQFLKWYFKSTEITFIKVITDYYRTVFITYRGNHIAERVEREEKNRTKHQL